MHETRLSQLMCPYCGESIELVVDIAEGDAEYIEDCEVCCRPMTVIVTVAGEDLVDVRVQHEND